MYILYVEDNDQDVDLTRRYLARHAPHIRMDTAVTYHDAVHLLADVTQEAPRYDLVLTDVRLPDGDGLKLLTHIRTRALPLAVVVLTGIGNEEIAVAALKNGADDYIAKRDDYLTRLPHTLETTLLRFRAAAARYTRTLRVLYAEHHASDIDLTRRHLARYAPHIQLEIVHSAPEVLVQFRSAQPPTYDLILLDYRLPGMTALDLLKELQYSHQNMPPIILVTGQGDEDVAVQSLRLGAADYLVKNPGYLFQLPRTLENTYTQFILARERAALFESEQRYRTLFERAPVAIYTKDVQGRYTSANTNTKEVFGGDPIGALDSEFLPFPTAERLRAEDDEVIRLRSERLSQEELKLPTGSRWFLSRKSPLLDSAGNVTGILGISLEITEQMRAEAAQRENERRLAQLAQHIDQIVWLQDTTTQAVLYVNQAYERVLGYSAAALYADSAQLLNLVVADDRPTVLARHAEAMQGRIVEMEYRALRQDGQEIWLATQIFPIADEDGALYRVAGIARDITEARRHAEQLHQQERLVAVGQMAAGIAHDFNNILAIIMLYTQMLQLSAQSAVHQRHLGTIYQQAQHAANLVQQILDFSRRSTLDRMAMDMVPFIKELTKLWQRTLPENIRVELAQDADEYVISADPVRLQQALMNIAINARDAMPQGGQLRVTLHTLSLREEQPSPVPTMPPGPWVDIAIQDTGSGIAPDILPRIFDPFFTTKQPGQGTGLGLAQVYGIVRQLDGFVSVDSELGTGTTFHVYLPLLAISETSVDEEPAPAPRGAGETVLLVEDEDALRQAMSEMLHELGYRVHVAANGRHALEVYAQYAGEIALIVSDLVMPDMGGLELHSELLRQFETAHRLPVLLVTGYPLEDTAALRQEHGTLRWLAKPFTVDSLARRVAESLHSPA